MKTKAQVIKENPDYRILINAVINRVGMDSIQDIMNHGINGGFNGFIYYTETHAFTIRYRKLILKMLTEIADSLGGNVVTMVENFGFFRNSPMDNDDLKDLYKFLGEGKPAQGVITNAMAWFAAEEVCRMFDE